MLRKALAALAVCGFLLAPLCAAEEKHGDEHNLPTLGVCVLRPTKGNNVRGTLTFRQKGDVCTIAGTVRNLTPGKHGFHIHEFGDLRSPDGTAAGGHFNPDGHKHGGPHDAERHVGDLGNIEADEQGVAKVKMDVKGLKLHFILGRSIVVHADADDLSSQPAGNAGPRVAVGVIGVAQPKAPESK